MLPLKVSNFVIMFPLSGVVFVLDFTQFTRVMFDVIEQVPKYLNFS